MRGLEQPLEVGPRAFGDELDRAIAPVANPTAEAERMRLADEKEAKADPLDVAGDYSMKALGIHDCYIVAQWQSRQ